MIHLSRKVFTIALALLVLTSALPSGLLGYGNASAAADEFRGDGTPGNPYLISTGSQLNKVRERYLRENLYFKLTTNIDLRSFASGGGWVPIGSGDTPFLGHFDGNGYAVNGLTITDSTRDLAGLFGYIGEEGVISNLKLDNVTINARNWAGGLAGVNAGGVIENSHASGSVTGKKGVGVLVGSNGAGTIRNSDAAGNSRGEENIGGLAGVNSGEILSSFAAVTVYGSLHTGGLIGWQSRAEATITDSHAEGAVTGSQNTGGLVGWNYQGSIIGSSHTAGAVSGIEDLENVGGLVGYNQSGTIRDSFASGNISGKFEVGGLVGYDSRGTISNSYASAAISGPGGGSDAGGLVGRTDYGSITKSYSSSLVKGSTDFEYAGGLVGYSLAGKIASSFATGDVYGTQAGGLVGANSNGEVEGSFATGEVKGAVLAGGLVGWNVLEKISNSYALGKVSGAEATGGLVGWNVNGPISNSYAAGQVSGTGEVGGLVGRIYSDTTVNSFFDHTTTGQSVSKGGTGKSTSEMQQIATYIADSANQWDFTNRWAIAPEHNGGYPYLREIQAYLDYDGNGNEGGAIPPSVSYMPGTKVVLDAGFHLTKAGYMIDGWNTKADGSGQFYRIGSSFAIAETTTLYASWVSAAGSATLTSGIGTVSAGGTANETITDIPYGTTLAALRGAITPSAGATFEIYDADGATLATTLKTGVQIVVSALGGTVRTTYTATVLPPSSDATLATTLGTVSAGGTSNETLRDVPYGSTLNALIKAITPAPGASFDIYNADEATLATELSRGSKVVVTAEDGLTKVVYAVSFTANGDATIKSTIGVVSTGGTANETFTVPYGTTLAPLKAAVTPADGATFEVYDADGITVATTLATGKKLIVTAENGVNKVTYSITVALNTDATMTSTIGVVSTGRTALETITSIPYGTSLAELKAAITPAFGATFEIYNSDETTVATSLRSGRKVIVTAQDGVSRVVYRVTIDLNSDATLTSTIGTVSTGGTANETITVPYGTTFSALNAAIRAAAGATYVIYNADGVTEATVLATGSKVIVTAQNGVNKVTYTVTIARNSAKAITAFSLAEQTSGATINTTARTVTIKVAHGTNLNGLVASFTLSAGASAKVGAVAQVSGVTANDFTNTVTYTITAEDNSTQDWKVTVTVAPSSEKAITSFSFDKQTGPATINVSSRTVAIEVQYGTSLNGLVASFSLSPGASARVGTVTQVSGTTANNFTNPVSYRVTAADNTSQTWTVTVTVAPNSAATLTSTIGTVSTGGTANETITNIPYGTTLAAFKSAITPAAHASFQVYEADGVTVAASLATGNKVIVTAQDGVTKTTYTITINAPSSDATLTSTIGTVSTGGTANETITSIPYSTTLAAFKSAITPAAHATFEVYEADGVTVATALSTGNKVIVTAQDGVTKTTYTVTVNAPPSSDATLTSAIGTVSAGGTVNETITDIPHGTTLVAFKLAITPAAHATFEVYGSDGVTVATSLATGNKVIVTAQDGVTKTTYTVTVNAPPSSDATLTSTIGGVSTGGTANETITNIPYGTTLAAFKLAITPAAHATFEVYESDGVTVATSLATGNKVIVTAQDGVTKTTYTVTVNAPPSSDATLTSTIGAVSTGGTGNETITDIPYATTLAAFKLAITPAAHATFEVYKADGVTVAVTLATGNKVIVTAQDGVTKTTYTVTVNAPPSSDATLTSTIGTVSTGGTGNETITDIPYGTTLAAFKSAITPAAHATFEVYKADGVTVSTALVTGNKVIVTAQDGVTKTTYAVTIDAPPSSDATLTSTIGTVSTGGTANETITNIPYGTTLAAFKLAITPAAHATFEVYEADGVTVAVLLATGNKVIVTAQDGVTKTTYVVTIDAPPSSDATLTSTIGTVSTGGTANETITNIPHGTTLAAFKLAITPAAHATFEVYKADGVTVSTVLATGNKVIVTAQDGVTKTTYTVTVNAPPSSDATLTSTIGVVSTGGTANETITNIPHGTTLAAFKLAITPAAHATFEVYKADGVTVATVLATGNKVIVTAQDGVTKTTYTVTVSAPPSSDATLTSTIGVVSTGGTANETITDIPHGTTLAAFKLAITPAAHATFEVYEADVLTVSTALVTGNKVIVTAQDGVTKTTYTVTVNAPPSSDATLTSTIGVVSTGGTANETITDIPYGTTLAAFKLAITPAAHATFEVYRADGVTVAVTLATGNKVIVTAQDGVTKTTYTVTIVAPPSSDATLTSTIGVVSTGGTVNETITDIPYGTTLVAFKSAITPAAHATFEVYESDGVTVATVLATGNKVIVTAQDGVTKTTYTVTVNAPPSSDATLTSTIGTVSTGGTANETITDIPHSTTLAAFKSAITPAAHATFEVYKADGVTVATVLATGNKVIVIAQDGVTKTTYTLTVNVPPSSDATLTSTIGVVSTGGTTNETITNIPYGTTLAAFKSAITPAAHATFEVYKADGVTVSTVLATGNKVIVTAQDGVTKTTYTVTVNAPPSSDATLTSTIGTVSTGGTVNETITNIPYGTTLAAFKLAITPAAYATFEVYESDGVTVAVTLATGNKVIVTAQDGVTKTTYTVTVNAPPSSDATLTSTIGVVSTGGTADETITDIPHGTTLAAFKMAITPAAHASFEVYKADGVTVATVLATGNKVIVTAQDGVTKTTYTVTVNAPPSSDATLTSTIGTVSTGGTANETITNIPHGTTLAAFRSAITPALHATFEVYKADGVTVSTVLATGNKVIVTAQDGVTKTTYTVTVNVPPSSDATLTSTIGVVSTGGTANETITNIPYGTTLAAFKSGITVAANASFEVYESDGVTVAVTLATGNKVIVIAQDGVTKTTYTVIVNAPPSSDATLTSTIGTVSAGGTVNETITDIPYGTTLAAFKLAITPAAHATFEVYEADGVTIATALATGNKVIVTAQDGVTKTTYTVTVNAPPSSDATLTSTIGVVSTGGTANETITNIPYGTTLAAFKSAITPAAHATFEMYESDGVTVAVTLATGNKVIVTAQDGVTKTTYTVTVNAPPSSDATLTSTIGTVSTGGTANETITNIPYGTTLAAFKSGITVAANASFEVYESDGVTVAVTLATGNKVIVTAQDGVTKTTYTVTVNAPPSSDATLTSTIGTVSAGGTGNETIKNIPYGTTLAAFKSAITPAAHATFEVYEADGVTVAVTLATGNKVIVTAQDGVTKTTYTLTVNAPPSNGGGSTSPTGGGYAPGKHKSNDGRLSLLAGQEGEVSLEDEVVVFIPAGAADRDLKITIDKLTNVDGLLTDKEILASNAFEITKNFQGNFKKPVTLTFIFNPDKLKSYQRPSVFYYDEEKRSWIEIAGGTINGNKITVTVDHFTKFAVFAVGQGTEPEQENNTPVKLIDIAGHWAESSIKRAVDKGIAKGYQDGSFRPNRMVTRAEFTVMLMNALHPQMAEPGTKLHFKDATEIGEWAKKAVAQAVQAGYITGYSDGTFRPDAPITRLEMAVMTAKASRLNLQASVSTGFNDDKQIPAWAKEAVAAIKNRGYMSGKGSNRFEPYARATRAEAVTVLLKVASEAKN
ncbi:S-layer homology domain-containing protein [Paenibacillus sp. GCM10012307]|uniref:S-layer homology domain-containing protein n=1 Tax=Paenibacillus roseus TaxID=2798579 RepID=A0A934J9F8_9BACL|nr:S-layer homology domain-containing protein [Paenibacillus roseus]MBJ6364008.1 S-layer homology domain-containing protein [Paenibacillus roseus]